jgi:hypothetical protein
LGHDDVDDVAGDRARLATPMRAHNPDKKDQRHERELFEHPLYRDQLQPVAELIAALRTAVAPEHYRALQQQLLGRFLGAQQFAARVSEEKLAVREEIAVARDSSGHDEIRRLSGRIRALDGDLRCVKAVLSIYRTIGDATVWRLMDYRRELIAPLGDGRRVGRLAAGSGLEAELAEIEWLWQERGVFALHADLTNCVRHGDILSIEAWEPKRIRLTEVKAGRPASDGSTQITRLKRLTQLSNDGFHPEAADGGPLVLRRAPIPYRTHTWGIGAALEIAAAETYTAIIPEPGLLIEVYDDSNPGGLSREEVTERERESRELIGAEDLLSYSIYNRRLRDRVQSFSILAPLPLLPLPLDRLAELLMGRFDVVTSIHAGQLQQRLASAGIDAEVARGADAGDRFLRIHTAGSTYVVPATVREQVLVELMTLETLSETLDWFLRDCEDRAAPRVAVSLSNQGEAEVWGSYR